MIVGVCKLIYHFPDVNNLKQKRSKLNSIKDTFRRKYNISIAEVDFLNLWQKTLLGISMVSNNKVFIEKNLSRLINEIENLHFGYISDVKIEFLYIGETY